MPMPVPSHRTPVLVVGAGVTGALTALELAAHGVPSTVLERARTADGHHDLLLLNAPSMAVLRRHGVAGPRPFVPAPQLVARLRQALRDHPSIDLRTGWTLSGLSAEADRVTATVIDATAGTRHVLQADHLAGCDGAHSTVRRCLDVGLLPLSPVAPHCTVYFRSVALTRRAAGPAALSTGEVTLITGYDGDRCVAHLPLTVAEDAALTDPAARLRDRLGLTGTEPLDVVAVVQSDGRCGVAASYRRGRAFLAGAAAHQPDPPGSDVDTCVGDAVDLARRLAGVAPLDGYETARRGRALRERAGRRETSEVTGHKLPEYENT